MSNTTTLPPKIQFKENSTPASSTPATQATESNTPVIEKKTPEKVNLIDEQLKAEPVYDHKSATNYCPSDYNHFADSIVKLQQAFPSYTFFPNVPIDCPKKPEDVIFSFVGTLPIYIERALRNGLRVKERYDLKFFANLIETPKYQEVNKYNDEKQKDQENLMYWRNSNAHTDNDYFKLSKYCKDKNFIIIEHDCIQTLANMIQSIDKVYFSKKAW